MKILSFGAGMQSTALALMSCENAHAAHTGKPIPYPKVPIYDCLLYTSPLLVGNIRIAVKHISSVCAGFVFLDFPGILKFRAVICENNRKVFLKGPDSNGLTKVIDRLDDAFLCTVRE